jgi:AraC family transcriptional regulator
MAMIQLDTDFVDLEQTPVLLDSGCRRNSTVALRYQALQRAIATMRERFMDALTLPEIADAAQLSPFHFDRVFRSMIGVSPSTFLASIRMKEAKRLLLTTKRSVTDVCFDVGYTSLGTFTSRFTLLVGLPPSRFRKLAQERIMQMYPQDLCDLLDCFQLDHHNHVEAGISGTIHTTVPFKGLIFVGLFPDPLPQGQPVECTILAAPGRYAIPPVPDGRYYLFGAAVDQSQDFLTVLAHGPRLHGGRSAPPVVVRDGRALTAIDITLSTASWADPPIVAAFPWFFMLHLQQYADLLSEKMAGTTGKL